MDNKNYIYDHQKFIIKNQFLLIDSLNERIKYLEEDKKKLEMKVHFLNKKNIIKKNDKKFDSYYI